MFFKSYLTRNLLLITFLGFSFNLFAQQLFVEAFSAYNLTKFDHTDYSTQSGYFPIGFKIAGGHEHVQGGLEYHTGITNSEFEVFETNGSGSNHKFEQSYYGLFVRGNLSSLPAYRFGLIGSMGVGYYSPTRKIYALEGEGSEIGSALEYEKNIGYNFYIGVSAPIWAQLHWELGYQFNAIKRQELVEFGIPEYGANFHSIHVGLSGNFVFGNTEKRCRRVYKSRKRR